MAYAGFFRAERYHISSFQTAESSATHAKDRSFHAQPASHLPDLSSGANPVKIHLLTVSQQHDQAVPPDQNDFFTVHLHVVPLGIDHLLLAFWMDVLLQY